MCAMLFSRVGVWSGSQTFQRYPVPWARRFVVEKVWNGSSWPEGQITADSIEAFLKENLQYRADSPRKFATNLHYLFRLSGLVNLTHSEREDWWASALFLFLDRCEMDGEISIEMSADEVLDFVDGENFWAITAANPKFAPFAALPIIQEYLALGGISRLSIQSNDTVGHAAPSKPSATVETQRGISNGRAAAKLLKPDDLNLTVVQRVFMQAQRQVRKRQHAEWVKHIYENRCAICGAALIVDAKGQAYSEAGHIWPVGAPFDGPDHFQNILPFCPNHHKAFDRGGVWIDPNGGKPLVRSATDVKSFDGRELELHHEHEFEVGFAEKHARYFNHI